MNKEVDSIIINQEHTSFSAKDSITERINGLGLSDNKPGGAHSIERDEDDALISETRDLIGEDFDKLSPELQEAIAKLPVLGKRIEIVEKEEKDWDIDGHPIIVKKQELVPGTRVSIDQIVMVRAEIRNAPALEGGKLIVRNAYENTRRLPTPFDDPDLEGGEVFVPRVTSHWTLNHRVESHDGGNWDRPSLVILAPGRKMIEQNGNPDALVGVDTFFEGSPILPEGTVIIARKEKMSEIPKVSGVFYVEIGEDDDINLITHIVLSKLGYTEVKGSSEGVLTGGFDSAIRGLKNELGIEGSGGHELGNVDHFYHDIEFGLYAGLNTRARPESMLSALGDILSKHHKKITKEYAEDFLDHLNKHIIPKLSSEEDKIRAASYAAELEEIMS